MYVITWLKVHCDTALLISVSIIFLKIFSMLKSFNNNEIDLIKNQNKRSVENLASEQNSSARIETFTNKEACSILHVTPRTMSNYRVNGDIAYVKSVRRIFYTRPQLEEFINRHSVNSKHQRR